jgi:hypothetical protein
MHTPPIILAKCESVLRSLKCSCKLLTVVRRKSSRAATKVETLLGLSNCFSHETTILQMVQSAFHRGKTVERRCNQSGGRSGWARPSEFVSNAMRCPNRSNQGRETPTTINSLSFLIPKPAASSRSYADDNVRRWSKPRSLSFIGYWPPANPRTAERSLLIMSVGPFEKNQGKEQYAGIDVIDAV